MTWEDLKYSWESQWGTEKRYSNSDIASGFVALFASLSFGQIIFVPGLQPTHPQTFWDFCWQFISWMILFPCFAGFGFTALVLIGAWLWLFFIAIPRWVYKKVRTWST
jgi:hypothetical protein